MNETDVHSLTVVFDEPIPAEAAETYTRAIRLMRRVVLVKKNHSGNLDPFVAQTAAKAELQAKIGALLKLEE